MQKGHSSFKSSFRAPGGRLTLATWSYGCMSAVGLQRSGAGVHGSRRSWCGPPRVAVGHQL